MNFIEIVMHRFQVSGPLKVSDHTFEERDSLFLLFEGVNLRQAAVTDCI